MANLQFTGFMNSISSIALNNTLDYRLLRINFGLKFDHKRIAACRTTTQNSHNVIPNGEIQSTVEMDKLVKCGGKCSQIVSFEFGSTFLHFFMSLTNVG